MGLLDLVFGHTVGASGFLLKKGAVELGVIKKKMPKQHLSVRQSLRQQSAEKPIDYATYSGRGEYNTKLGYKKPQRSPSEEAELRRKEKENPPPPTPRLTRAACEATPYKTQQKKEQGGQGPNELGRGLGQKNSGSSYAASNNQGTPNQLERY